MSKNVTYDYHGLSVQNALVRFVADYNHALHSDAETKRFIVVHGYGSSGRGGKIKKALLKLLTFENNKGVLTFKESGQIDTHPGYTVVTPKCDLHSVPPGFLSPFLPPSEEYTVAQSINSRQRSRAVARRPGAHRSDRTEGRRSPARFVGLNPSALRALDRLSVRVR